MICAFCGTGGAVLDVVRSNESIYNGVSFHADCLIAALEDGSGVLEGLRDAMEHLESLDLTQ